MLLKKFYDISLIIMYIYVSFFNKNTKKLSNILFQKLKFYYNNRHLYIVYPNLETKLSIHLITFRYKVIKFLHICKRTKVNDQKKYRATNSQFLSR